MKAVKNVLTSYIKLSYVYVKFKWTNQSCLSPKIRHFFQWKLEKLWLFDKERNVLIEKNRDMGSEKYNLLDFAKHLSFSEVQKNSKVFNVCIGL